MKTTKNRNKMFLTGIAAKATLIAALAFGLVLMGCPPDVPDPPSISISGTPKVGETLTASVTNNGGNLMETWWSIYDDAACTEQAKWPDTRSERGYYVGGYQVGGSSVVLRDAPRSESSSTVGKYIRASVEWQENTSESKNTYYSNILGPVVAADLDPLTDVTLTPATPTVTAGSDQVFTLKFKQGASFNSDNIVWSIVETHAAGTTITAGTVGMDGAYTTKTGTLIVASGEGAITLTVKATYGTQSWTANVTVN